MWSKIIDILLGELQTLRDPRRRLAKALKELLETLENCHECYKRYRNHPSYELTRKYSYHRPPAGYYELADVHRDATLRLISCLWNLRHVLPVFAPSVMDSLWGYTISEIEMWCPKEIFEEFWDQLSVMEYGHKSRSKGFRQVEHLLLDDKDVASSESLGNDAVALDFLRLGKLTAWAWGAKEYVESVPSDYDTAITTLREYIRQEFKPEEMF